MPDADRLRAEACEVNSHVALRFEDELNEPGPQSAVEYDVRADARREAWMATATAAAFLFLFPSCPVA